MSFVQGNLGSHKKVVTKTIFVKKYSGPPLKKTPYQKNEIWPTFVKIQWFTKK